MRRFIFIILFSAALMAASCVSSPDERNADATLSHVEDIMSEYPDSALRLLSDSNLHPQTQRQKALYALLLTQARHKNYIDETNDSLIATAVDYFDRKDDEQRLMKSLFYHATINSNAANYPAAMTSAMRAKQLAEKNEDIYWQARIAELTGHLFSETFLYEESAKSYKSAAIFYKIAGWEHPHLYSLLDMARELYNSRNYDEAFTVADSIRQLTKNSFLLSECYGIAFDTMFAKNDLAKAEKYADSLINICDSKDISCHDYFRIAQIKFELGKKHDAEKLLNIGIKRLSTQRDTLAYNAALLFKFTNDNNIAKANATLHNVLKIQNNIAKSIRQQSSVVAQRDYFSQETIKAQHLAERRKNIILYCITIAIFAIIISFIYYRYNIQRKGQS